MSKRYMDWTDWAGDHHEEAYNAYRGRLFETCEHAEVSATGHCENCGIEVEGFEPDDAQLLTQTGTRDVAA